MNSIFSQFTYRHIGSNENDHKNMLKEYKARGKKKFMGREYLGIHRITYIINSKGEIIHIFQSFNQVRIHNLRKLR